MSYQGRIREIQSAFIMGYQDRETCIRMFEDLLHDYGLLPKEEQVDRSITNESFLTLLKMAKEHKVSPSPESHQFPQTQAQNMLRDIIKQRCPVCQQPASALFNRIQGPDGIAPVDPPRCQDCMGKWIEDKFGVTPNVENTTEKAHPSMSVDLSPISPMSPSEVDFFAEYEKQMKTLES